MEDISNRTLATLLIAAIVITLGGTIMSLNRLSQVGGPSFFPVTGRGTTDTGKVNVTIQSSQSIRLMGTTIIDFGAGNVNASDSTCNTNGVNVTTVDSGTNELDCWLVSDAVQLVGTDFDVENDGNVDVAVNISGKSNQSFITTSGDFSATDYKWQFGSENTPGDVDCEAGEPTGWVHFGENETLCTRLPWEDEENDNLTVNVMLRFPANTTAGLFSDTVTFSANPAYG
ncbi:MAG: hypothetical protein KKF44_10155 [Nanoarchaeota archaeon]|nr:hypothetical protein [Nanoarchaeota archaeon]